LLNSSNVEVHFNNKHDKSQLWKNLKIGQLLFVRSHED
jgi:hypothetical protein